MGRKLDKKIHEQIFGQKVKLVKFLSGYMVSNKKGKKLRKPKPEYEYACVTDFDDAKGYLYEDFVGCDGYEFIIRANEVPRYSSNLYDMELLINKMREKGWKVLDITEDKSGKWFASFWYDDAVMSSGFGIGKTLSEALCKAALRAIKKKVGKRNVGRQKKKGKNKRTR